MKHATPRSNPRLYTLTSRDAATGASEHWTERERFTESDAVADTLAAPPWRLAHGDLVRVTGLRRDTLYVFDADAGHTGALVRAPKRFTVAAWEGEDADAVVMLRLCEHVDRRRLVLAACACARTVLDGVPAGEDRPRVGIETAERWARGEAPLDEVHAAYDAAWAAASAYSAAAYSAAFAAASAEAAFAAASAAEAAYSAAFAAASAAAFAASYPHRALAPLVREHVPLSVAICADLGLRDPLPLLETK